jgi:hypothetical protein
MELFPCIAETALVDALLCMVDSDRKHRAKVGALVDSVLCIIDSERKHRA